MNLTIAGITARALLGRRRVLLLLPMPLVLVGMTLLGATSGEVSRADWGPVVFADLGLGVILPLTALIIGSSVLGLEIEDGTITHLITKPLPRREIVLSKLLVAWLATTGSVVIGFVAAALIADSFALAVGLGVGGAVGALAYSALFLTLSLLTKRPVAVGLVYIMLWENLLVPFVDGAKVLSVREYAASLADEIAMIDGDVMINASLPAAAAVVLAAALTVAGSVAATVRLRSFSLTGDTA